jgi:hypothetical protein
MLTSNHFKTTLYVIIAFFFSQRTTSELHLLNRGHAGSLNQLPVQSSKEKLTSGRTVVYDGWVQFYKG